MTIEFQCDGCLKTLRTADDKAGRTARCPQCGKEVTIPPSLMEFETLDPRPAANLSEFEEVPVSTRQPNGTASTVECPICGEANDPAASRCRNCGEPLIGLAPTAEELKASSTFFNDVWERAWDIWKSNLGINIAAYLLCGFLGGTTWFGVLMVSGMAMAIIEQTVGRDPFFENVIMAISFLVMAVLFWPIYIGFCHFALENTRQAKPTLGALVPPWQRLPGAMLGMLGYVLLCALLFAPGLVFFASGTVLSEQGGDEGIALLLMLPGMFLMFVAVIGVATCLWPIPYMLADGKLGVWQSLVQGPRMGTRFLGLSFILMLANMAINLAGSLICCVGPLFTYPLAAILFAVAYEHCRLSMKHVPA